MSSSGWGMMVVRSASPAHDDFARAESERFKHLVLGHDRPPARSAGRGRSKRKIPVELSDGVEREVASRERWSHKQGTPQTLEHASRTQQGALARLHLSGAIDAEQLASAAMIASVAERIAGDVTVRTASLDSRVDTTRMGDGFWEALGAVRLEVAYTRWRAQLRGSAAVVLDMIVEDIGLTIAAKRHRIHNRRARQLLIDALDAWPKYLGEARKEVDPATIAAAHAGIL